MNAIEWMARPPDTSKWSRSHVRPGPDLSCDQDLAHQIIGMLGARAMTADEMYAKVAASRNEFRRTIKTCVVAGVIARKQRPNRQTLFGLPGAV